ncbi:TonB-dependent hemoglobin/transferrin/lactoferrin family receptor [Betaproteobacteria bacterium PRO4]|uniref:TonB-dependent hemoglobin/transferrin/lactoferrin family receptor n=1 Tax=Nitrosomonas sp. TaxID=42353 RepID=UPI00256DD14A|nr:TonB-dependent hemoglobin/transferrin/lactoferrin family receptor [Nitrosomonas sp.]MBE7527671.1 TonB-dependent hemoglobin/transferrin/lactoferrin family receptor [Burkholderiales bacterium]MDL1867039.1 TonB-dependent hemoglobin/transferrin/lactoferrin family receptor [Betaproteobacteria bacterium PRO4]
MLLRFKCYSISWKICLATAIAFSLLAHAGAAETVPATPIPDDKFVAANLQQITVTATRSETELHKVPATITKIDEKDIQKRRPHDEAALFEDEPDMVMSRDARRYGATTINIRGIEGIRVLQMVDGVRLPEVFTGGGNNNTTTATSDSPEMDFLQGVEILRGPASSLYGSEALGGVIGYRTLNPEDLLADGKNTALRYRFTWRDADKSFQNTGLGAIGSDQFKLLLGISGRNGHELSNRGSKGGTGFDREKPNNIDNESLATLAKLAWLPTTRHRVGLTFERRDISSEVDTLRMYRTVPKMTGNLGAEELKRNRWSLDWEWKPKNTWLDRFYLMGYHQKSATETYTQQNRRNTSASCSATTGTGNNCEINMDVTVDQKLYGFNSQLEKMLVFGSIIHNLTSGFDWRTLEISQWKDSTIFRNGNYNNPIKLVLGETYPNHGFTPGRTRTYGLFLQDSIEMLDGDLVITPGIRYDRIELRPDDAPLFMTGQQFDGVSRNFNSISPKLSALWQFHPQISVYGQAVRGFRAPNYNDVNGMFHNSAQRYARIANPDLKPETSIGYEIGTRFNVLSSHWQIALYHNEYKDFIKSQRICGSPNVCLGGLVSSVFQHINYEKATIRGAEIRTHWTLPGNWYLNGAVAYSHGDVKSPNGKVPLNSIEPLRGSLSLGWEGTLSEQIIGAESRLRAAHRVSRADKADNYYQPDGYGVVDLSAWWKPRKNVHVGFNLNNLFDRKFWVWSDIRQSDVTNDEQGMSFYSQPGRNFSVALQIDL